MIEPDVVYLPVTFSIMAMSFPYAVYRIATAKPKDKYVTVGQPEDEPDACLLLSAVIFPFTWPVVAVLLYLAAPVGLAILVAWGIRRLGASK